MNDNPPQSWFSTRSGLSRICVLVSFIMVFAAHAAHGHSGHGNSIPDGDLTELSLEELINIEITSVSKKSQKISDAAAAIHVITREDIRRSGVTSIPEALRMVPGLQVARIDANKWAISSRGFNGRFANKLLVLMDGRSVYTPLFSGVFWDTQDTLLEDIDRIEVIRGPGATLWGANAVNGVINIITRPAMETQGTLITAGAGTEETGFGAVRQGGHWGEHHHYRLYSKYFSRDHGDTISGLEGNDEWDMFRVGGRLDLSTGFTLQGEVFTSDSGDTLSLPCPQPPYICIVPDDIDTSGGHLMGKWGYRFSDTSDLSAHIYFDRTTYDFFLLDETVDTLDFDFNHRFSLGNRQKLIWGCGYRFSHDDLVSHSDALSIREDNRDTHLFSGFLQDEIAFLDDTVRITLGSKFEHNSFTGFEIQPNVRAIWIISGFHSLWSSVSRSVRTPSRLEDDIFYIARHMPPGALLPDFPGPGLATVSGSRNFDSETIYALELGYRILFNQKLSLDMAGFYNLYDDVMWSRTESAFVDIRAGVPTLIIPTFVTNDLEGESHGVEITADWRPFSTWTLRAAYTFLKMHLRMKGTFQTVGSISAEEGDTPNHQASFQSFLDLPGNLEWDAWVRYVDGIALPGVDAYITVDTRLGWHITPNLCLAIVGRNLVDSGRLEFIPQVINSLPTEIERSVYGKVTWRF